MPLEEVWYKPAVREGQAIQGAGMRLFHSLEYSFAFILDTDYQPATPVSHYNIHKHFTGAR